MYKGKFDQKSKPGTEAHELVAQRNAMEKAAAERKAQRAAGVAAPKSANAAAPKTAAPAAKPAAQKAPAKAPAKAAAAAKTAAPKAAAPKEAHPQKKKGSLGTTIFYTLYFLFILLFFVATLVGMYALRAWLVDFEAAQPTTKAEQVFQQIFTNPNWSDIYAAAGASDTAYEGKEAFATYMTEKTAGQELNYLETSAGLSGNKKYIVRLGSEKLASFTLSDRNKAQGANELALPDWQLSAVEVFFDRSSSYRIEKVNGHTTKVNGVELGDESIIQIATTRAEEYLPVGTAGVSMCTQEITGLFAKPVVEVFDTTGQAMEVSYDEASRTFTERTAANTIGPDEREAAVNAAQTYCLWMIKAVTDRATVAKYFDPQEETYQNIVKTTELWMQSYTSYDFADTEVKDYARYTDNLFSVRVSMNLNVTRPDGTVKAYPSSQSMFFKKSDSGKWLCTTATNVDVSQPVGRVRLTFMQGDTQLTTDFYQTDAKEIVTPIIPTPEGKVFAGWVRQDKDANGVTTLTVVFQPDATGRVVVPSGVTLTPMTLYAYFEDAGAATAPAATEGEG